MRSSRAACVKRRRGGLAGSGVFPRQSSGRYCTAVSAFFYCCTVRFVIAPGTSSTNWAGGGVVSEENGGEESGRRGERKEKGGKQWQPAAAPGRDGQGMKIEKRGMGLRPPWQSEKILYRSGLCGCSLCPGRGSRCAQRRFPNFTHMG